MGDSHVGLQARLMSQALRKLTGGLNQTNTTMIFINQLREKIGVFFGSPETTAGGKALKFYASVRLDIRRIETLKDGTDAVGNRTRVKVVKNKMAPPFKQAEFDILYGIGISREGSLIDFGVEHEIVREVRRLVHLRRRPARPGQGELAQLPAREPRDRDRDRAQDQDEARHHARPRGHRCRGQGRRRRRPGRAAAYGTQGSVTRRQMKSEDGLAPVIYLPGAMPPAVDGPGPIGRPAVESPAAGRPARPAKSAVRDVSIRALTRRDMSRWELEQVLRTRDLDEDAVAAELARLEDLGLIDDGALADMLVRTRHERKGLGRSALAAELRRRHVAQRRHRRRPRPDRRRRRTNYRGAAGPGPGATPDTGLIRRPPSVGSADT